jgi:quinol monooxygenase YgiN
MTAAAFAIEPRKGTSMSAPFIFITTHKINPGQLDEFKRLSREFEEFVRANEPDLLAYYAYLDEDTREASLVQIHRDASSGDFHMEIADKIAQCLAVTTTVRAEVYGNPGPVVGQVEEANTVAGVPVSIKADVLGGFTRGEGACAIQLVHQYLSAIRLGSSS